MSINIYNAANNVNFIISSTICNLNNCWLFRFAIKYAELGGLQNTAQYPNAKIWKFGLKNIDLRFNHYDRNDGLKANIVTFGIKFVVQ